MVECANGSFVNSPENIFVFNYNLNNNAGINVRGHVEPFLSYWGVENSRTPEPFTELKVWIISPLAFSNSTKMASKDADVLKHSNFKSDPLPDVFHPIVVPVSRSLQAATARRGVSSFWDRDKRQNWTLVAPKLGPLLGQLSLQGYQLEPEYAGGYGGQKGTYYSSYRKYLSPLSDSRGYYVLAFLFLSALICGISAYYVDNKWPNAGWIPMAIFAFIAAICFSQLYSLSSEFLSPFVGQEDHVTKDLKSDHASAAGYCSTGIGLGPTYIYAHGPLTFSPEPAAELVSGGRCPVKLIPAFTSAVRAIAHASVSGAAYNGARIPNATSPKYDDAINATVQPHRENIVPISCANELHSGSAPTNWIDNEYFGRSARNLVIVAISVEDSLRHESSDLIFSVLSSASAARALDSEIFSSERRCSASVFDLAFLANKISAATPRAINASAPTGPHASTIESPWRYTAVSTTSTISPKTTATPPHSASVSFSDIASRNSSSPSRSTALLIFPLLPRSGRPYRRPNLAVVILAALLFSALLVVGNYFLK
jgi:hypothetical protein